jgi:hypothetical protein
MLATEMFNLRETLGQQGITFCYSGYMTESILLGIGNAIKTQMQIGDADTKVAKGVFAVFVEQVQNVIRYSAEKIGKDDATELRYGILTVGNKDDMPFVACGNMIEVKDAERLRDSLTHIKGLDRDGLKALWKETLRGETPAGSKGAGVGFIDIARNARHGIEFDFRKVDDEYVFFTLKAML